MRVSVVPQGGVRNTRCTPREYPSFEKFVTEWDEPTEIASAKDKERLPYFVGGEVEGKRHDKNVKMRTLLTLDIEAAEGEPQPPKPEPIARRLQKSGSAFWLYTTASHKDTAPRYRIVMPLAEPVEADTRVLKALTLAAAEQAGVEDWCKPESWVLSQPMYLPAAVGKRLPQQWHQPGKPTATDAKRSHKEELADIPDKPLDPVLVALRRAGLYHRPDAKQKGKHYIACPFDSDHGKPTSEDEESTQTVYYEAHFDGNPRPSVKCFDSELDEDGKPHLTYRVLVNWLREHGHLHSTDENAELDAVLEDEDAFLARVGAGSLQAQDYPEREFVWERFAPVGSVTVLVGAGGSSKSALMLRLLYEAAFGRGLGPIALGVRESFRGLYVTYEDDHQELNKRLRDLGRTLRAEYGDTFEALYGNDKQVRQRLDASLFLHALDDTTLRKWRLATKDERGNVERGPIVEWLIRVLERGSIRVLVLDPAGMTHGLDENDPADMAEYVRILTDIARRANCAVVVIAHATKMTSWAELEDINQGALRGSSATADHSRSVFVLASMRQKWAPRFGLPATPDAPSRYGVLFHVKHNYSAPVPWQVFERKGPVVIPRTDLKPLSREDMQIIVQEQKAKDVTEKVDRDRFTKAIEVAEYLDARPNATAHRNQIDTALFGKRPDRLGVVRWCIEQGYVSVPANVKNGLPKPHTLTDKGREALLG